MAKRQGKPKKKCVACGRAIHSQAATCRCGAVQPRPQENDRPEEQTIPADPTPTTDETMAPESTPKPKRTPRPKKTALPAEQPAPEDPTPATVAAVAPEPPPKPKRAPRPTKKSELSAFVDAIEALGGLDAAREALDLLERAKRL
jgi:hypothetical protein